MASMPTRARSNRSLRSRLQRTTSARRASRVSASALRRASCRRRRAPAICSAQRVDRGEPLAPSASSRRRCAATLSPGSSARHNPESKRGTRQGRPRPRWLASHAPIVIAERVQDVAKAGASSRSRRTTHDPTARRRCSGSSDQNAAQFLCRFIAGPNRSPRRLASGMW